MRSIFRIEESKRKASPALLTPDAVAPGAPMSILPPSREIATELPKFSPAVGFGSRSVADNEKSALARGTDLMTNPNPKNKITTVKIPVLDLGTEPYR